MSSRFCFPFGKGNGTPDLFWDRLPQAGWIRLDAGLICVIAGCTDALVFVLSPPFLLKQQIATLMVICWNSEIVLDLLSVHLTWLELLARFSTRFLMSRQIRMRLFVSWRPSPCLNETVGNLPPKRPSPQIFLAFGRVPDFPDWIDEPLTVSSALFTQQTDSPEDY